MSWTQDELAGLSLARQFPETPSADPAELVARIGPMQTQTARSAFLGLAARSPGITHAAITAAYEDLRIVRGSTLRGTVHTSTPEHHRLLDAVTREGQRRIWVRTLGLEQPEAAWQALEEYAADDWRTPAELADRLRAWLSKGPEGADPDALETTLGRYLSFGHGGLLRRPLSGGWDRQGAPGYRTAQGLLGLPLPDPDEAVAAAVRVHLASYGPASRNDLAWWSGLGLRRIDAALAGLADAISQEGPDGRVLWDLPEAPAARDLPGVRLVPEFDAILCGYDPKARHRFVDDDHHRALWHSVNGQVLPPMLVDGRIGGYWRAMGSARRRPLTVHCFPGTRRPRKSELEEPVAALEAALDITVTEVGVQRA